MANWIGILILLAAPVSGGALTAQPVLLPTELELLPAGQPTEALAQAGQTTRWQTSVGMRLRIRDLALPGTKLKAQDVHDPGKADMVVRVLAVSPHGTDFRYDFEVMPFVPGELNLADYLVREDGSSNEDLPNLNIGVSAVLPTGQIEPNSLAEDKIPRLGGYWNRMIFAGIIWVLGLFFLFYLGRKTGWSGPPVEAVGPQTLAQRLKPMVESAQAGTLSEADRAGLERLLLAYWREKRGLKEVKVSNAMSELRSDAEAGPLFLQLEKWLYQPSGQGGDVDIAALLEPYRDVPDLDDAQAVGA